jgi:hypothetical protein
MAGAHWGMGVVKERRRKIVRGKVKVKMVGGRGSKV